MWKERLKAIRSPYSVDRKVLRKEFCVKGIDDVRLEKTRIQNRKIYWTELFYHSLNGLLCDRQISDIERDGVDAARAVVCFVREGLELRNSACAGRDNPAFRAKTQSQSFAKSRACTGYPCDATVCRICL